MEKIKSSDKFAALHISDSASETIENFRKTVYPDDLKIFDSFNIYSTKKFFYEIRCKDDNNKYRWCFCQFIPINENSYFTMYIDLSDRENEGIRLKNEYIEKKAEMEFNNRLLKQKYNIFINHSDMVFVEYNLKTDLLSIDSNLQDTSILISDYKGSFEQFIKSDVIEQNDKCLVRSVLKKLKLTSYADVDFHVKRSRGEYVKCNANFYGVYDDDGTISVIIGSIKPISDNLLNNDESISDKSFIDGTTGLFNGKGFCKEIKNVLSVESNKNYAVIMFDIERFKSVNEIYGIPFGDLVIKYISGNLKEVFSYQNCISARFMSDFFGVFTSYTDDSDLKAIIEKLNSKISYYKHISLKYAYGVYRITDKSLPVRLMCDYANMAKSSVKGNHINNISFYTDGMKNKIIEEINIENDMEKALAEQQFVMYLQPKYNIGNGLVVGAEALARWNHPSKGFIKPIKFIPLFEKNGFIIHLDAYIWEQACKSIRKWIDSGVKPVPISVNVSRVNLKNPMLINILDGLINKYGIEKKYLELEITETVYYDDQQGLVDVLDKLKMSGYTLLMDDFGSGFSSLSMLKNTPFDVLKFDRNFLNETMITDRGKKIIQHTICLSNDIGMNIVAEGVETKEQAEYLYECGCNVAQGYYYSKPVPVSCFEEIFTVSNKI